MIHYAVAGREDAEVLVLGPSLGTDLTMFDAQVDGLADRYRVVRFDLRGHGRSPVEPGPYSMADLAGDVVEVLDHLGVRRCHYLGVSIGGAIGQWLALHHPDRLITLTVCATAAQFCDPPSWAERAAVVRAEGTAAMLPSRLGTWVTHSFACHRPQEAERLAEMLLATSAEGYAGCCEAIGAFDVRAELGRITTPTLVLAGAEDPATPVDMVRAVADGIPGSLFTVVPDAAHLLTTERPEVVNAMVAGHLARRVHA
ncbi:3-oxoadipate enol-lactonase [Lentzea guizhouensis]|uniref:3-oxoadipate enol-lactonase n=1 Tax=Lentzea guizhouensis TaxID=1586287 RepID=UPI000ADC1B2D|nr:3-oxoadipate enol-lactonase [Lentzea guizhouensis]